MLSPRSDNQQNFDNLSNFLQDDELPSEAKLI